MAAAVRELAPGAEIVGIEREAAVLDAARRHFQLDRLGVELRAVDARDYLASETRRFDLIVEDLFVGPTRTVRKPDWLTSEGYAAIARRLRPGGFVSANTIHESPSIVRAMRPMGHRVVSLDVRGHWNRIVMSGRDLPAPRRLRAQLARRAQLERMLGAVAIRTR